VNLSGASFGGGDTLPVTVTEGVLVAGCVVAPPVSGGAVLSVGGLPGDWLGELSRAPAAVATRSKLMSCHENKRRIVSTPVQTSSALRPFY
jgi:hypothetical protein